MTHPARNAMTVDVEEHFQVQAFAHCIDRGSWDSIASRIEANVDRILQQFADKRVSATFFTLGWIAERHKTMIHRIVAAGHELASHGYDHTRADIQDAEAFRADVRRSRRLLEDIGGVPVCGYRAATFSIGSRNQWAFGILEEEGYEYSSSVNPITHDLYGMPNASRTPYRPGNGHLCEIPMTTLRAFRAQLAMLRRRLLPAATLSRLPSRSCVDQPCGPAGCVLFPSVGRSTRTSRVWRTAAGNRASAITII